MDFASEETRRENPPQGSLKLMNLYGRLIRDTVYPKLKDHPSVLRYPEGIPGMVENLFFFNHDNPEDGQEDTKSKANKFEAKFTARLAKYLMQQDSWGKGTESIAPFCVHVVFCRV